MSKTSSRTKKPLVSIIMPAYNAELYIRESIDSVLRQNFTDYEFIIINDGSKDGTQKIIDYYTKLDKRIVAIKQRNKGLVSTLNYGLERAKGRYIARIDADDPWMKDNKLSKQLDCFKNDDSLVIVGGGFEIINEDGHYIETVFQPTRDEDIRRALLLRNPFGHAGVMFKKKEAEDVGGYSHDVGPTEDLDLWIKLLQRGRAKNLPEPVYRYRIVSSGISQTSSERQTLETNKLLNKLWNKNLPRLMSRREILKQADRYMSYSNQINYSIGLKEQFLSDNAQIGVKLIRHGNILGGIYQIIVVASIGRSGLRAVKRRLKALDIGSFTDLMK